MAKKVYNKRSNQRLEDGSPKLPDPSSIEYGEITINYAKGVENVSFKNSENEIFSVGTQVIVGDSEPENGSLAKIFIDEAVDPITVEVYTKEEINEQVSQLTDKDNSIEGTLSKVVTRGNEESNSSTQLLVDETSDDNVEIYTKQEVNDLFNKLKQLNPALVWE